MILIFSVRAPDFAKQKAVRKDLAHVAHEEAQKIVFGGGETQFFASQGDAAVSEVYYELASAKNGRLGMLFGVPQGDAQAGEQFGGAEWFGDIIVRAGVQGGGFFRVTIFDAEDDDGNAAPFAQTFEH